MLLIVCYGTPINYELETKVLPNVISFTLRNETHRIKDSKTHV